MPTVTTTTATTASAVKPGYQTTEFILVVIVKIYTLALAFMGQIPPMIAAIIVAAVTCVYAILRTIVKVQDPGFIPPDLPAAPATTTVTATATTAPGV